MNILTSRPEGMSFQEYKEARRLQGKALDIYKQGTVIHCSSVRVFNKKERKHEIKTGTPFKKPIHE